MPYRSTRLRAKHKAAVAGGGAGGYKPVMVWNILMWLLLGGLVGWIASILMRTDAQQGLLLNIAVGIAGALVGALIFYRGAVTQPATVESFAVALVGAVLLLALVNLVRRGRLR